MRFVLPGILATILFAGLCASHVLPDDAAEPAQPPEAAKVTAPLVETYLHSGGLARGEAALNLAIENLATKNLAIEKEPENSHLKFQLGVLLVFRGVERLGQNLYEHGARDRLRSMPLLRLPVPQNPKPSPISYRSFRRILEQAAEDLARAEAVLAQVTDESVVLPLRLAEAKLDLDADGRSTDSLIEIFKKLMQAERFSPLEANPEFLVKFDRGDVAWLRAYCHLLMSVADLLLAFDWTDEFYRGMASEFATSTGAPDPLPQQPEFPNLVFRIVEPARLQSFRKHLVRVCELNVETWKFVRAETDDDHEWLPNPRQGGVLRLPVTNEMIDAWLDAIHEFHGMLNGEKLIPYIVANDGVNMRTVLSDPPTDIDFRRIIETKVNSKYLQPLRKENSVDFVRFFRVIRVFEGPLGVAYAAWFN
jgi:hypothetical protein